jgi:muconolactone delta-isomerase
MMRMGGRARRAKLTIWYYPGAKPEVMTMLFLVVSTPRPERPSELATARQSFWPWIGAYEARGVCRHVYARAGRGAVAVLDVADNEALHKILNEWADIIPAHFDVYPLVDAQAANRALAAQVANKT